VVCILVEIRIAHYIGSHCAQTCHYISSPSVRAALYFMRCMKTFPTATSRASNLGDWGQRATVSLRYGSSLGYPPANGSAALSQVTA
jgi:hypothetical protein